MVRLADLSININWLLKGEGSMYLDSSDPSLMTAKTKKKLQLLQCPKHSKAFHRADFAENRNHARRCGNFAGTPMPVPERL